MLLPAVNTCSEDPERMRKRAAAIAAAPDSSMITKDDVEKEKHGK